MDNVYNNVPSIGTLEAVLFTFYSQGLAVIFSHHQVSGADPGFEIRGGVSRRGIWGLLKVPSGSRAVP